MRRMTAWLMALCIAATCALPAQAEEEKTSGAGNGFQWATVTQEEGETGSSNTSSDQTEQENETKTEHSSETEETETSETEDDGQDDEDDVDDPETRDEDDFETDDGEEEDDDAVSDDDDSETDKTEPETQKDLDVVKDPDRNDLTKQKALDWNDSYTVPPACGGVEVVLGNGMMDGEQTDFSVSLKGPDGTSYQEKVSLGDDPDRKTILFEHLESGEYTLAVMAEGYQCYEQNIHVEEEIKTAVIYTGFVELEGCAYEKGSVHPGVMLTGDWNGDGRIDETDRDVILDAISSGKGMDLSDLQYYANSRAKIEDQVPVDSSLTSRLSGDAVSVNFNLAGTEVSGKTEDLFREAGGISLKNKAGETLSEDNPAEIGFHLLGKEADNGKEIEQIVISMKEDKAIDSGVILVEMGDGDTPVEIEIKDGKPVISSRMISGHADTTGDEDNVLIIDLGGQVAVKKVAIRITGAAGTGNLVEITQVEFLNDMENRIPEPEMDVPQNLQVESGSKSFTLTWDQARNVTGYEVEISYDGETQVVRTATNRLEVKNFKDSKLKNGEVYTARVQSVNGAWRSGYGAWVEAVPKTTKKPDAPDNLRVTGGYRSLRMNWKDMEDTDTYQIYYRESGSASYQKISGVAANSYEIRGLKDQTRYEVYVTGVNDLGEGPASIHSEARTIAIQPAQMPSYGLINESRGKGKVSAHIVSVTHRRGNMESSPLDTASDSALGTVDKDFGSCYQVMDWDDGGEYVSPDKGLLFTLDDYYKMNYITFAETEDIGSFCGASVFYYDKEHPNGVYAKQVSVVQRKDAGGRRYYAIKLAQPITANRVRLGFTRYGNLRNIVVAEVNFYHYDSLEDDILSLYADDLHTSLRSDVTKETIDALQTRLDTKDPKSGEYHPERTALQKELENARGLLDSGFNDIVNINPAIASAYDSHLGFSGLNAWQPLGVTAYEGEQIVVYVGHDKLRTGSRSALQLVATQYHAESGAFASVVADLRVGRNEITLPAIQSLACEGGGALYVQYTGSNEADRYAVRVSGGVKAPVLNLYGVTDEKERAALITAYVEELETHVAQQEALHKKVHEGTEADNKVNRPYDKQNCILGATDIMLDQMMLSVSAEQILAGLGSGSVRTRAGKLDQSLRAMDEMLELFYHHKGLSADENAPATDRMPARHLNIRYMRMFSGAFMYASGNHIGIEWGSVPGLASAQPVASQDNGKYISGRYFGWGIAHEIGHNINQGCYALAEVTNNYFALLAGAKDSNDTVRFQYLNVYQKVTSNTAGRASNVFTQLAMYWQLHLAYDRGYNYKIYDSYKAQHTNLFYARVDSYARDTALAPGALKLTGDRDQNLMRLACAAAEKDLTEFFLRWGLTPDGETIRYAEQFPEEERALYYLTDDARVYEMEHGTSNSIRGKQVISFGRATVEENSNAVKITLQCTADPEVILGYEIARYHYENGQPIRQVVGFSTDNTYTDYVSTINNRALTYEVTPVDQFGYRADPVLVGDVRISHDGSHSKSMWTVNTNMVSDSDVTEPGTEQDPCEPAPVSGIYQVIDNEYQKNTYTGHTDGEDAIIELHLNQALAVCGIKFTSASRQTLGEYEIQVSLDGSQWTTVKQGTLEEKAGSQTVYFENAEQDSWVCTYDAAYVRLRAVGQSKLSMTELDLLGPSGDSVSFGVKADSTEGAVGILQEDYVYEKKNGAEKKIPAGSLLFMGRYKGNPAYNMVVLYDESGNVIGGLDKEGVLNAEQIILADVPESGMLGEVSDGVWIYWIRPDENGNVPTINGKVRAQMLRVNNALTNEGQRIVSDTLPLKIPDKLDGISLKNELEETEQ